MKGDGGLTENQPTLKVGPSGAGKRQPLHADTLVTSPAPNPCAQVTVPGPTAEGGRPQARVCTTPTWDRSSPSQPTRGHKALQVTTLNLELCPSQ